MVNYSTDTLEEETVTEPTDTTIQEVQDNEVITENPTPVEPVQSSEPDYLSMSDEEFEKYEQQMHTQDFSQPSQAPEQAPQEYVEQPTQEAVTEQPVETQETDTQVAPERYQFLENFHAQLTAEFNANGRKIKVESPEDYIRLAQMGLNYNKKMQELKPHLTLIRTLEKAGLTAPEKVQFLMDLAKHEPTAIAKLLQDSKVETYDLPDLEETPYQPKSQLIPEKQVEFESVIQEVQGSAHGVALLNSVQQWDDESINFIAEQPEALRILQRDKEDGTFDKVMGVLEADMAVGRIPNEWLQRPRIELYDFIANQIANEQSAANPEPKPAPKPQPVPQQQRTVVGHNVQTQMNRTVNTAPKAAGIHHGSNGNFDLNTPVDVFSMTDAQFEAYEKMLAGVNFQPRN